MQFGIRNWKHRLDLIKNDLVMVKLAKVLAGGADNLLAGASVLPPGDGRRALASLPDIEINP